ncbi:MAG: DUF3971 domain-containing protein [Gammaproteobacteria bacterium]|nr:DUF3971 domain-containing protein [Gammaproteobacteria bacterium]
MSDHFSKETRKKKAFNLRKLKNWILSIVALMVIILAISFTLIRVAIKSIPDYSMAIQKAVSEQMGLKLEVGFLDAEIYWLVPRLNLIDVNVSDKEGKHHLLHLQEIDLSLDWAESIKSMTPVIGEITLIGLNVQLGINKKSQLLIQNYIIDENIDETLKTSTEGDVQKRFEVSEAVKHNLNNLDFKILNSQFSYYDERHQSHNKTLSNVNLHLINSGESHVVEVKASFPKGYGNNAHFIIDLQGDLFDYKNLDGKLYLAIASFNAESWLDDYWNELKVTANAKVNGKVWLEWSKQEIVEVNSQLSFTNLAVHYLGDSVNTWSIDHLDALFRWSKTDSGWKLDVRDLFVEREGFDWLKPAAATLEMRNSQNEIKLQADFLRVEGFVYLAGMLNSVTDVDISWLKLLEKYKPSGALKNLDVSLPIDEPQDIKVNAEFSQLGFLLPDIDPAAIVNLKGSIAYLDNKTWLLLNSKNSEIKFRKLFRNPIKLNVLQGALELSHQNNLWELSSQSLVVDTPHIETEVRLDFNMPDNGKPFLDLTANFQKGDVNAVSLYLPAGVMGPQVVKWLDNALYAGLITQGGYQFYGYLGDAPFRLNEGISLADFDVTGVDLNYLDNWPDVNNISANLRFQNDSMLLKSNKAELFDSKIEKTVVYIDNFISPTLDVKGRVNTQLKDLKRFIGESDLRDDVSNYLDNLQFEGAGDLDLELFLPLYGNYHTEVGGKLLIKDGEIEFSKENYELKNINGLVRFAGDTVESTNLKAKFTDSLPEQVLDVNIKTQKKPAERLYQIDVSGNILASSLLAPIPDIQHRVDGSSDWDITIGINNIIDNGTSVTAKLNSDLQGVTTNLPGPLAKLTEKKKPVEININVKSDGARYFNINLNNGDKIEVNDLKDKVVVNADTKSVKGVLEMNTQVDVDLPIDIKLEYLDLNKFLLTEETEILDSNLSATDRLAQKEKDFISPRDLPSFDLHADKLIWKNSVFTDSTLNTQKTKLGAVIKEYKLTSENNTVSGKGSWFTGKNNESTTKLDVNIEVADLGKAFKDFEISDSLFSTSGNINLRWQWKAAPYEFDWKILNGDGQLRLRDGTLKDLDAGAGRLLGLFNFETLLSLDFGSQMKEGFNFDKVSASVTFSDENIYSDDFEIESKVADIFMKGRLSIANNSIDQTITVKPHVGATVTLGTTVVAGPAIGGLVYLFQKIFNTDRLSEYQYSMKGSIDSPVVELISVPVIVDEQDEDSDF